MRIDKVYIEDFKNLKQFSIDLDENEMKTVLLGQNAVGKSNFMEALILIFKFLDLSNETKREPTPFEYYIKYQKGEYYIEISYKKGTYTIFVNNEKIKSLKSFFSKEGKEMYQPKYVFTYYSGLSNKLKEHFWKHQYNFYKKITSDDFVEDELDSLRKLFYVQLVHSYFVLLAYFTHEEEESVKFLKEVLDIEDIESILFILKMPDWAKYKDPNDIFWTAKGLVRPFLEKLWTLSIAPIYHHKDVQTDFDHYDPQDQLYLYLRGKDELKELASIYTSNTALFKALESTYISKLISEVKIKVRKEIDGEISFKELSEGEQQLLTVLGLLKFTKDEDSLILLDEPDTHLNPLWKWQYLEFLDNVVKRHETTQIIINTHDPLVIGSLKKEEVRIFRRDTVSGKTKVEAPLISPREMSIQKVLTSDLFGLPSIMNKEFEDKLNEKRYLQAKMTTNEISEDEIEKYEKLKSYLDEIGFYETTSDSRYNLFLKLTNRKKEFAYRSFTNIEMEELDKIAKEVLSEINGEEQVI